MEKVQIGGQRIALKDIHGAAVEMDNAWNTEQNYSYKSPFSYASYSLIDSIAEDEGKPELIQTVFDIFRSKMDRFEYLLKEKDPNWEEISKVVDLISLAKFYLAQEFLCPPMLAGLVYFVIQTV
ncbi:MAG: hypothetical protein HUJ51_05950 [Eggerthellaceae bacterium]|nr:hypothetical protein [Eggerthellaceae bacterium]